METLGGNGWHCRLIADVAWPLNSILSICKCPFNVLFCFVLKKDESLIVIEPEARKIMGKTGI